MGGGKSHYIIVFIIILVHPSALPERVQWRKYIKYFISIQHLAFFTSGKCHANNYLIIFAIFAKKYLEIEEIFV